MFNQKRLLIIGDSGRGKTSLARMLSKKLKIKQYSTDDFFWKTKFTVAEDKKTSVKNIAQVYNQNSWIVEGTTRSLIKDGIEKSDIILYLVYPSILSQFLTLFKRKLSRKEERWRDLLELCIHLIDKKYGLRKEKGKIRLKEMIKLCEAKVITLHSFKEIDQFVDRL